MSASSIQLSAKDDDDKAASTAPPRSSGRVDDESKQQQPQQPKKGAGRDDGSDGGGDDEKKQKIGKLERQESVFMLDEEDRVILTFQDVSLTVVSRETGKNIKLLDNLSGIVRPGELLGVMGPSGSGKTTLLDLLAGRLKNGTLQGEVKVNGHERRMSSFQHYAGYVPQETVLVGTMTVAETLRFSAQLSLPEAMDEAEKERRVDRIMRELGLYEQRETRIGNIFLKGISGGQQKRVSIGVELLTLPTLIFLDEPTSGLDSSAALRVMEILQNLTRLGHTVVCSIHQPSSDVFYMLDRLLVLNRGRAVYFGETDAVVDYFQERGMKCPDHFNPADFVIRETNTDFSEVGDADDTEDIEKRVEKLVQEYEFSDVAKSVRAEIDELNKDPRKNPNDSVNAGYSVGPIKQFTEITKRTWTDYAKNPAVFWVRLIMYSALSIAIATMYADISNGQKSATDRVGILFYIGAFFIFMSIAVCPAFISDRAVFARERANGWYSPAPYALAQTLVGLPGLFLICLLSTLFMYWPVGFNDESGRFGLFLLALFLSLAVAEAIVATISALVGIYIVAMALGAGAFGMMMLCQGFFIVRENMPLLWKGIHYISLHTWSFRAFMWIEFDKLKLVADQPISLFTKGEDVLAYYDMDDVDIWRPMVVMLAMLVFWRLCFYAVLRWVQTGKR